MISKSRTAPPGLGLVPIQLLAMRDATHVAGPDRLEMIVQSHMALAPHPSAPVSTYPWLEATEREIETGVLGAAGEAA